MKQLNTRSESDEIIQYLQYSGDPQNKPHLSKLLKEKLERIYHCEGLIRTYASRQKVAPMMMKKFDISQATAYRDFADTQAILGTTQLSNKNFWLDILLGKMWETHLKATIDRDWGAVARIEKNILDAIAKLAGNDKTLPFDKVQPAPVKIGFFPELMNVHLPDNYKEQIEKLLRPKGNNNIQDAEVIEDGAE